MTIEKYKDKAIPQLNRKGKYATSTENRRLMWEYIIWPLVLELIRIILHQRNTIK